MPSEPAVLQSYLEELNGIGAILFLKDLDTCENGWVVLDIGSVVSTINGRLFSVTNQQAPTSLYTTSISNLGIIPEKDLETLFPEYPVTLVRGCLTLLQFCHSISQQEIACCNVSETLPDADSFLFFPALLVVEKAELKWVFPTNSPTKPPSLGWYARCKSGHYFPPRYLHVLLLRLAFGFALQNVGDVKTSMKRRCNLWKNGIHWVTEEGVEVMVQVVEQNTGVLVIVRGDGEDDNIEESIKNYAVRVVREVVQAKEDFCATLEATTFLVSLKRYAETTHDVMANCSRLPNMDDFHYFEVQEVNAVLTSGRRNAVSTDGSGTLPVRDIVHLKRYTNWGKPPC